MSLTPTAIILSDKGTVLRTKFNDLISDFANFTFDEYGNLLIDSNLSITGSTILEGSVGIVNKSITLNLNESGTGVTGNYANIKVDRGTLADAILRWNDSTDLWEIGLDGGSFLAISLSDHVHDTIYYTKTQSDALYSLIDGTKEFTGTITVQGNLILKKSTTPTGIALYNTYTSGSVYERGFINWNANVLEFGVEMLGATAREIGFSVNGGGTLKLFTYSKSVADDATITLPVITDSAFGWITVGDNEERCQFSISSTGTLTMLNPSGNVVTGADTDGKVCLGTSGSQEPLVIKNRLGSSKVMNMILFYN